MRICIRIFLLLTSMLFNTLVFSADKIIFQLAVKQWVHTETALLTVNVSATLSNSNFFKARAQILNNLNQVAQGKWNITQFDRTQDNSGFEKIIVAAQLRLPQADLSDIYQRAKSVSNPGAIYEVSGIEFQPSFAETQRVKMTLRCKIYQQINEELGRLKALYPQQHFTLHQLIFFEGNNPFPQDMRNQTFEGKALMLTAGVAPSPSLTVSKEIILNALVEVASSTQEGEPIAH